MYQFIFASAYRICSIWNAILWGVNLVSTHYDTKLNVYVYLTVYIYPCTVLICTPVSCNSVLANAICFTCMTQNLISSPLISSHFISSHLFLSHLISSHLIVSYRILLPDPTWPYLNWLLPDLTWPEWFTYLPQLSFNHTLLHAFIYMLFELVKPNITGLVQDSQTVMSKVSCYSAHFR